MEVNIRNNIPQTESRIITRVNENQENHILRLVAWHWHISLLLFFFFFAVMDLTPTKSFPLLLLITLMADNICPLAARPKTAVNGDKEGRVRDTGRGWGTAETARDTLMLFVGQKWLRFGTKVQRLTLQDRFPRRNWGIFFFFFNPDFLRFQCDGTSDGKVNTGNFLPIFSSQVVLLLDQIASQTTNCSLSTLQMSCCFWSHWQPTCSVLQVWGWDGHTGGLCVNDDTETTNPWHF